MDPILTNETVHLIPTDRDDDSDDSPQQITNEDDDDTDDDDNANEHVDHKGEPIKVLERRYMSITFVSNVALVWIVLVGYCFISQGFLEGYIAWGPGASSEEEYPFTPEAAIERMAECEHIRKIRNGELSELLDKDNVSTKFVIRQMLEPIPICEVFVSPENRPRTVQFFQFYIDTLYKYIMIQMFALGSSLMSAWVTNTAYIYICNIVQDSTTISIPYSESQIQYSGGKIVVYFVLSTILELSVSFIQIDFAIVVTIGQLLFRIYLTHQFMEEKRIMTKRSKMKLRQEQHLLNPISDAGTNISMTKRPRARRKRFPEKEVKTVPRGMGWRH